MTLQGTRDARPLRPADVAFAESGRPAPALPFPPPRHRIGGRARARRATLRATPKKVTAGVQVWLALAPGRKLMELDAETRERLKAMGYLGAN